MKINNKIRRIISALISCVMMCAYSGIMPDSDNVYALSWKTAIFDNYYPISSEVGDALSYSDYYDKYSEEHKAESEIILSGADYKKADGDISKGALGKGNDKREDVLIWKNSSGKIIYETEIEEGGIYCIKIDYYSMKSNASDIEFSMTVDGKIPYDTASRIKLGRVWVNEHEIYTDSRGNQVRPPQIQTEMWQSRYIGDSDGLFSEPLILYLEKGTHEIAFSSEKACLGIDKITLAYPQEAPEYAEYSENADIYSTPSTLIRIEGENAEYKSASMLCPSYDNTEYNVSPSDPIKVVYNTIGGAGWSKSLQSITWKIPQEEILSDGWYKIGIKAKQNQMRGFSSNRRIYIDNEVVCRELEQVKFGYDTDWQVTSPKTDDGEYIYVYLTAGEEHTITLEAVPGEIGNSMRKLDSAVSELSKYYRQILMITGPNPDKYTDYYVHEKIPNLTENLDRMSSELKQVQTDIENLSGSKGSEASAIERMTVILDKCVEKPLRIPDYLSQIKDNITAVSAWSREYRDQPLEIDYIELASADMDFTDTDGDFFESAKFGLASFFGSFFEDYTTLSDVTGEDAVEVWVSLGRDQAVMIKELTENEFIPEYNIPVSVNLVVGGVVEATLAGKGPDIALFLGGEFPVNLAARDLLVDLSGFDDYNEVSKRFQSEAAVPYSYNGGVFGLPISRTFPMMFYRTDILSELGFSSPPETWDKLIDMLPALQRNYMSAGLVLPPNNISPATEAGHTFATLLLQSGGNYYNDAQDKSMLGSIEAVNAFEKWTDFYTKYSFAQSYDAFSRFRTGEYPIVIANYTFFNQLTDASPEINGLWDFAPVPATKRPDGTLSHATNSNGSGAVIFNKVKNKENAWEYIKWFTGTETQVRYGTQLEGMLGTMGRFDTANTEALSRLSWSESELSRLMAQQNELIEIPIIPSSYAVTRNIMNAFREVVNEGENPRDTLMWYNRDINDEIERKLKNLGD